MNSESTYAHCKSGAVVTEVLCFSGSNQWTAHPKQQHALTYTSTFWYVLKIFLLPGCAFSTRLVALRSIHPEMQTISAMTAFSLTSHARSRVIKIVRHSFGISICLNETLQNVESSIYVRISFCHLILISFCIWGWYFCKLDSACVDWTILRKIVLLMFPILLFNGLLSS